MYYFDLMLRTFVWICINIEKQRKIDSGGRTFLEQSEYEYLVVELA